jgi:hypothetical protein
MQADQRACGSALALALLEVVGARELDVDVGEQLHGRRVPAERKYDEQDAVLLGAGIQVERIG